MKMTLCKKEMKYLLIVVISLFIFFLWWYNRYEKFCETEECRIDMGVITHLKNVVKVLAPEATNYEIQPGAESVTINKEKIYICMRNPTTGVLYPFDILLYVTLHEISHVLSKTYSTKTHNDEFKQNFTKLLNRAFERHVLSQNVSIPDDYCKKQSSGSIIESLLGMFNR